MERAEDIVMRLTKEILSFEERWKIAKLTLRNLKKHGVLDAEIPDDLRIERAVFYKEAKRKLKHAMKVANYKLLIRRNMFPTTVADIQQELSVSDKLADKNLQPFMQALHELEAEGAIKIEREAGTAHEAAKDTLTENFSPLYTETKIQRTLFTANTPSHGFAGAVCPGCRILLAVANIVESVSK